MPSFLPGMHICYRTLRLYNYSSENVSIQPYSCRMVHHPTLDLRYGVHCGNIFLTAEWLVVHFLSLGRKGHPTSIMAIFGCGNFLKVLFIKDMSPISNVEGSNNVTREANQLWNAVSSSRKCLEVIGIYQWCAYWTKFVSKKHLL